VAVSVLVLSALARPAIAQDPAPAVARDTARSAEPGAAAGASAQDQARAHFEAAMADYRAHRYREAIHGFKASRAYLPNAELWFNIGRAHERLGEDALAIEHYRLYLRDRVDAPDASEVRARIAEIEARIAASTPAVQSGPRLGNLAIDVPAKDALVLLDGARLGMSPIDRVMQVEPGRHRIEASRPGYIPFRADVEVQPGALSAAYVELRPLTVLEPEPARRVWTWIAAGASAGALLASGTLGLFALDRRDAGEFEDARGLATASDVALGTGIVLAVSAVVLYFAEAGGEAPAPAATAAR
jgi:tetratricopeptide (TPR) repeat protein